MTGEEVKKGLRVCMTGEDVKCRECPYMGNGCAIALDNDAFDYIEALEGANANLKGALEELRELIAKHFEGEKE